MKPVGSLKVLSLALLLVAGPSCDRDRPPAPSAAPVFSSRGGVTEVGAGEEIKADSGQTIYVPAYSYVHVSDGPKPFNLAITLSIRNTDPTEAIVVKSVTYQGSDGRPVRKYLVKPVRVAPLAALEFFVKESDTSGGSATSFLVDWVAEAGVTSPVAEAVMIGTLGTQGISFVCPGRVTATRAR